MAGKITAKDLAEKKGNFVLIDVREADEVAEDGTIDGVIKRGRKNQKRRIRNDRHTLTCY